MTDAPVHKSNQVDPLTAKPGGVRIVPAAEGGFVVYDDPVRQGYALSVLFAGNLDDMLAFLHSRFAAPWEVRKPEAVRVCPDGPDGPVQVVPHGFAVVGDKLWKVFEDGKRAVARSVPKPPAFEVDAVRREARKRSADASSPIFGRPPLYNGRDDCEQD